MAHQAPATQIGASRRIVTWRFSTLVIIPLRWSPVSFACRVGLGYQPTAGSAAMVFDFSSCVAFSVRFGWYQGL
ncbi:hypothetical protein VTK26DRAFT_425 [Humicola hyalothermophila]